MAVSISAVDRAKQKPFYSLCHDLSLKWSRAVVSRLGLLNPHFPSLTVLCLRGLVSGGIFSNPLPHFHGAHISRLSLQNRLQSTLVLPALCRKNLTYCTDKVESPSFALYLFWQEVRFTSMV